MGTQALNNRHHSVIPAQLGGNEQGSRSNPRPDSEFRHSSGPTVSRSVAGARLMLLLELSLLCCRLPETSRKYCQRMKDGHTLHKPGTTVPRPESADGTPRGPYPSCPL